MEGKFSAEYCIVRALLDGKVGLQDFTDERINQPEVSQIMQKIKRRIDLARAMLVTTINMQLRDRRQLSQEELMVKYKDCAQLILSHGDIARSLELL